MKNSFIPALLLAAFVVVPSSSRAVTSATLKTYDAPYAATLSLEDAGFTLPGKRAISYRISIKSKSCQSSLEGTAVLFARTDERQDDSAFLRNGELVKTNVFKDAESVTEVTVTMDVESKTPRYADVVIKNKSVSEDACIPDREIGLVFFQKPR